mgnify:CR=1 FL=1
MFDFGFAICERDRVRWPARARADLKKCDKNQFRVSSNFDQIRLTFLFDCWYAICERDRVWWRTARAWENDFNHERKEQRARESEIVLFFVTRMVWIDMRLSVC